MTVREYTDRGVSDSGRMDGIAVMTATSAMVGTAVLPAAVHVLGTVDPTL